MANQAVERTSQAWTTGTIVVLLVDDQPFVGAALERLLAAEPDIQLVACCEGLEAVARATAVKPDLILQDLLMPGIDGLDLLRQYRANPATSSTPVIVMSGNNDEATRSAAFQAGAVDYLVKLPSKQIVLDSIRRHGSRPNAIAAQPADGRDAAPVTDAEETLDLTVIAAFRQGPGGTDFTIMLIDQFLLEADTRIDAIRGAVQHQDAKGLKSAAHALKGGARIMGAKRLGALCARLEQSALDPQAAGSAAGLAATVNAELVRVRRALAAERKTLQLPAASFQLPAGG